MHFFQRSSPVVSDMDLKVVDDNLVKKYLMERLHVPDYQAEIDDLLHREASARHRRQQHPKSLAR